MGGQVLQDLAGDRGGRGGAEAGLVDDDRHRVAGLLGGREAGEPGVGCWPVTLAVPVLPATDSTSNGKPWKVA